MNLKTTKVAIYNLGCKVNKYESDAVMAALEARGYTSVQFNEIADIYIVNTCAVTAEAERKSAQILRRAKRKNPEAILVAMGCMTVVRDSHSDCDLVIANRGKADLANALDELVSRKYLPQNKLSLTSLLGSDANLEAKTSLSARVNSQKNRPFEDFGNVDKQTETRAVVKIQDGCNQFCSYCVIPLTRGRTTSRNEEEILEEVKALVASGYKEVSLIGINLVSYGCERGELYVGEHLVGLLKRLESVEGLKRLRLGSLDPQVLTEEFLTHFKNSKLLCKHMHLSLQSGSTPVLTAMRRPYTAEFFSDRVKRAKELMSDLVLTTDIIVAFPNEKEENHKESMALCKDCGFAHIHVFKYSVRPHTQAAAWKHFVPAHIATRRSGEFLDLSESLRLNAHQERIGKKYEVLLEQKAEDERGIYWTGYTANYLPTKVYINDALVDLSEGSIIKVKITDCDEAYLYAERLVLW